jgi:hypothetical protein
MNEQTRKKVSSSLKCKLAVVVAALAYFMALVLGLSNVHRMAEAKWLDGTIPLLCFGALASLGLVVATI